jgi:hypothetical protein
MVDASALSHAYWDYAACYVATILNKTTKSDNGKTAWEIITGREPNLDCIHEFGTFCYVQIPEEIRTMASFETPRSLIARILGQDGKSSGWIVRFEHNGDLTLSSDIKVIDTPVDTPFMVTPKMREIQLKTRPAGSHAANPVPPPATAPLPQRPVAPAAPTVPTVPKASRQPTPAPATTPRAPTPPSQTEPPQVEPKQPRRSSRHPQANFIEDDHHDPETIPRVSHLANEAAYVFATSAIDTDEPKPSARPPMVHTANIGSRLWR